MRDYLSGRLGSAAKLKVIENWAVGDCAQPKASADSILAAVSKGSMPCDGAWPPERVALFRDWIAAGCPP